MKVKPRTVKCRKKVACVFGVNGCTYFHNKLLHVTKQCGHGKQESELSETDIGYQEEAMTKVLLRVLSVMLIDRNDSRINTFPFIDHLMMMVLLFL